MAYRFRLIALLLLFSFLNNAHAVITVSDLTYSNTDYGTFSSQDSACNAVLSAISDSRLSDLGTGFFKPSGNIDHYFQCRVLTGSGIFTQTHEIRFVVSPVCPSNSSKLKYNTCTCASGFIEEGDKCVDPNAPPDLPDVCENIASTCSGFKNERMPRFEVYYSGSSPSGACSGAPISGCSKGCYLQFTGVSVYYKDQDGKSVASGPAVFTGDSCDHSEEASEPDPEKVCKAGEFPGTVNGTKVCLPAKSKETEHQSKAENNADGSSSETTSTVSCVDGKCTVTETTTTKDFEGNVIGVSSGSTSYSEPDFCQKNPASGVCSGNGSDNEDGGGKGSFGGSCSSGFICEGDAATCAIAKEQHRMNCELVDSNNPFSELFDSARGTGFGVEELDFDLSSELSFDSIIGSGTCPADVEINVFGRSVYFKFSVYCPYFSILGNLLVFGALLGAFRILGSG